MKKVLCLILAMAMCLGVCAQAANETSSSTQVEYIGSREPSGGGGGEGGDGGDSSETVGEYYEIIVPALMNPGDTDEVFVEGYWAANRKLTVTTDNKVTMTNSKDGSTRDLTVTFDGISEIGSNTDENSASAEISVQDMNDVIFGSWTGTITYTIAVSNA